MPDALDRSAHGGSAPPALRTMRATEVLDEALRLYRLLAPVLLRRCAVPAVFVLASVLFCTRAFGPRLFTTTNPGDTAAQVTESGFVLAVGLLVAGPLLVFGVVEATTQAVALAGAYREGRWKGEDAASREARRAFPRAFGAGLWAFAVAALVPVLSFGLMGIAGLVAGVTDGDNVVAGLLAVCGGFGVFFGLFVTAWAVGAYALVPAVALRGASVREACRQSRKLMKGVGAIPGGFGAVWAVYGVLAIATLAESLGIGLAVEYLPKANAIPGVGLFSEVLSLAIPFVVAWTLLPFWGVAVAVLDGERRVRKEGFDVELLAKG